MSVLITLCWPLPPQRPRSYRAKHPVYYIFKLIKFYLYLFQIWTQRAYWAFVAGWTWSSCLPHISLHIVSSFPCFFQQMFGNRRHHLLKFWAKNSPGLVFRSFFSHNGQSLSSLEEATLTTFPPSARILFSVFHICPVHVCGCRLQYIHPQLLDKR